MVVGCDLVQQAIVERSYSVVHLVLWLRHPTMIGVTPKKPVHRCVQRTVENGWSRSISGFICSTNRRLLHLAVVPLSRLDGQLFGFLSTNCRRLPTEFSYLDFVT